MEAGKNLKKEKGQDIHGWVIYDEDPGGGFLAVSKFGPWTIHKTHVKKTITEMRGNDLGIYEITAGPGSAWP